MNQHRFFLIVETSDNRKAAESAVLSAFIHRNIDNCKFHLKTANGHKKTWMDGARAGFDTAVQLMSKSLEKMRNANRKKLK